MGACGDKQVEHEQIKVRLDKMVESLLASVDRILEVNWTTRLFNKFFSRDNANKKTIEDIKKHIREVIDISYEAGALKEKEDFIEFIDRTQQNFNSLQHFLNQLSLQIEKQDAILNKVIGAEHNTMSETSGTISEIQLLITSSIQKNKAQKSKNARATRQKEKLFRPHIKALIDCNPELKEDAQKVRDLLVKDGHKHVPDKRTIVNYIKNLTN